MDISWGYDSHWEFQWSRLHDALWELLDPVVADSATPGHAHICLRWHWMAHPLRRDLVSCNHHVVVVDVLHKRLDAGAASDLLLWHLLRNLPAAHRLDSGPNTGIVKNGVLTRSVCKNLWFCLLRLEGSDKLELLVPKRAPWKTKPVRNHPTSGLCWVLPFFNAPSLRSEDLTWHSNVTLDVWTKNEQMLNVCGHAQGRRSG